MKKLLFLFILMLSPMLASAADVKINEATFPDLNFRNWVLAQDYGADGVLTDEEQENITSLDVRRLEIHNLKGIEYFTALKVLNCITNKLTTLDLSHNTALEKLECVGNRLTTINLLENKKLKYLSCPGSNPGNQLTALDVSECTELDTLACSGNPLETLDVSKNTKLRCLECYSNQLTVLDLSKNTVLRRLHCNDNKLTTLDLSKNTALDMLQCSSNLLTTLDITNNSALTCLSCANNKLTTLYVPNNKSLEWIICSDNQLTSLDVSGCSALKSLVCENNQLSMIYLSGCSSLISLNCSNNQLTTLDFSDNSSLTSLYCPQNHIKGTGMDALVESLPIVSVGSLYVMHFEKEQNVMTTTQVAVAKARGWTPYIFEYDIKNEYTGSEPDQDDYRPFIEEGKVWKLGGKNSGNPVQWVEYYYFDGDTIIDGKSCKQMMCQRYVSPDYRDYDIFSQFPSQSYVGAWYEEDKKVYFYVAANKQFQMKYDYSLNAYDTLQISNRYYVIGSKQMGGIKGFKGVYRDVMMWSPGYSNYNTTWLEGVGSIEGPTKNIYLGKEGYALFLMSCTVGDEVIYLNDEYEDGATSDVCEAREVRFDFTHTVKTQPRTRSRVPEKTLYGEFNALELDVNLDPLDDVYQVRIIDASGKVVYEKTINAGNIVGLNIDISTFAEGSYTVSVENSRESFVGEFNSNTTGIEEVRSKRLEPSNHYIYNLQGQRLSDKPAKGLYIQNGKKVAVK